MKKYFKYIFLAIIILFSFYFTEKTAILKRNNDPILQIIKDYSNTYNVSAIDAKIEDNYIIPGMYGKRINEVKSLIKMKSDGVFNSLFLVFDDIKPNISLDNNKDKIITKGNEQKKGISLIIDNDNSNIITYLISNKINTSILINKDTFNNNPYFEQINNDYNNYNEVEKLLNKNRINTNICILNRTNKELCIRNKKYIIEPTHILKSNNLVSIKNKITSGDIILIKDSVSVDDLDYLIKYINNRGLKILKLSELIKEKN